MRVKFLLTVSLTLLFMLPLQAIELRLDTGHLSESNQYDSDYLYFGNYLDFRGEARDLYFFGEKLELNGNLKLGLIAAGQLINIDGEIHNGIKAGGQIINIHARSEGTNFIAGQEINCEPTSSLNGDTFVAGARAHFRGPVKGDLYVGAGEVHIENEIIGNVQIRAGQINFSDKGRIVGDVIYFADQKISEEDMSKVTGNVQFVQHDDFLKQHVKEDPQGVPVVLTIFLKISLALIGFIILIIPATKRLESRREASGVLSTFLWGLIPLLIYPTLIIILTVLIITIPLSLSMILAVFPITLVMKTIGLTLIGGYLATKIKLKNNNRFLYYLIAIVPYSILSSIPFFGFLLLFVVVSVGWGVTLSWLVNKQLVK